MIPESIVPGIKQYVSNTYEGGLSKQPKMMRNRWQYMKTAAILILISFLLAMVPGCSAFSGKADKPGQNGNGTSTGDGYTTDGNCPGGENSIGEGGLENGDAGDKKDEEGKDQSDIITDPAKNHSVERKLAGMSLDEKIGQMFIIGVEGTSVDEKLKQYITTLKPGGIILFRDNITDPEQLLSFINGLKAANSGWIPLFISVDEEGGRISRMPEQLPDMPSAMSLGGLDDPVFTYVAGRLLAEKIKIFGFNMDFAPVLDITSNPQNTVIGDRAFGTDEPSVSKHGIQMMKGIRDEGVIAVVKHFPGHGDTEVDSHYGLPVVTHGMERLENFELVPFRKAFDENADAVMVAHIVVESLDPDLPASLSGPVITGLLRDKMGFDGVVITDDMTMRAITNNFDIGDAAVRSVIAGSDIILVCHGYDKQKAAMDAVKTAVETGTIDMDSIDRSVSRILRLKDKYAVTDNTIGYADAEGLNEKIEGVLSKWYNVN